MRGLGCVVTRLTRAASSERAFSMDVLVLAVNPLAGGAATVA
ncbi:hypothetical protein BH20CHL6_BH20CHL6_13260 [soil metagenome]